MSTPMISESKSITDNFDVESDAVIPTSIHVGPGIVCENIENVQTNNYYSCICFKCQKKVRMTLIDNLIIWQQSQANWYDPLMTLNEYLEHLWNDSSEHCKFCYWIISWQHLLLLSVSIKEVTLCQYFSLLAVIWSHNRRNCRLDELCPIWS